jgi:hypothetical protein
MKELLPTKSFENILFEFRGVKIMIDVDLAAMYEIETNSNV